MDAPDAASLYIDLGWYPIPLRPGTKECKDRKWMDKVYIREEFEPGENVGIRLVKGSDVRGKKVVGVDLDAPECVALARHFLPPSSAAWGRASKAVSHILYCAQFEKAVAFRDLNVRDDDEHKSMVVEIRVNHQSMAPPSVHPCGERLYWVDESGRALPEADLQHRLEAPEVDPKALLHAVRLLATSALVARYYNQPGARHEWALALSGSLRLHGLSEDECIQVIQRAGELAGEGKPGDRLLEVRSTYNKAEEDPTTGGTRLAEIIGLAGPKFVESLRKIWGERSAFHLDGQGKRVMPNSQDNVRRALDKMGIRLSHDLFADRYMVERDGAPRTELNDPQADRIWLEIDSRFRFRPGRDLFDTVLRVTARETQYHPVRDYLTSLTWDGTPRLDTWLIDHARASDSDYVRAVGAMVLIAAVRRVMSPGCKFDDLLVLESPQGQNKSTALRTLCPREDWFSDDLPLGVDAKLTIERTAGKWIIEAAELLNMRKAQVEQLKAFLSRQVDGPVRLAYARHPTTMPRQFIIVGTTNSTSYLRDPSGNRRFWPVRVRAFNITTVREVRDQLWAEAAHRERAGESIRLHPRLYRAASDEQEERRTEDPWESLLDAAVGTRAGDRQRVTNDEVWTALGVPVDRRDERAADRVATILQRMGFRRMSVKDQRGVTVRGWGRDLVEGIWKPAGWID